MYLMLAAFSVLTVRLWVVVVGPTFGVMTSEEVSHRVVGFLLETVVHSMANFLPGRLISHHMLCRTLNCFEGFRGVGLNLGN